MALLDATAQIIAQTKIQVFLRQPRRLQAKEAVKDDESEKDVVKIAVGSKDHTTLVAALKQADLVTSLSNAGPFCSRQRMMHF